MSNDIGIIPQHAIPLHVGQELSNGRQVAGNRGSLLGSQRHVLESGDKYLGEQTPYVQSYFGATLTTTPSQLSSLPRCSSRRKYPGNDGIAGGGYVVVVQMPGGPTAGACVGAGADSV